MLYNGHVAIADTFLRNRPNHGQTLIEKPVYSGHSYSGHFFLAVATSMIGWEKRKHIHVFI